MSTRIALLFRTNLILMMKELAGAAPSNLYLPIVIGALENNLVNCESIVKDCSEQKELIEMFDSVRQKDDVISFVDLVFSNVNIPNRELVRTEVDNIITQLDDIDTECMIQWVSHLGTIIKKYKVNQ